MPVPKNYSDETVTVRENTEKYAYLPEGTMGYLEEKIRSAMWAPKFVRVQKSDGLVGNSLLKQVVVSATIRKDEEDRDFCFPYKAEVSFDMGPWIDSRGGRAPIPFLSTTHDRYDPGRRHSTNPFPLRKEKKKSGESKKGKVRRPDVIIVSDESNRWPGRGKIDQDGRMQTPNLQRLVEVKFEGDEWGENQENSYVGIAGDEDHMTLLEVTGGERHHKWLKEAIEVAIATGFLTWVGGALVPRARVRGAKPVARPAYFEAWFAIQDEASPVGQCVASLWDTAAQGVRHLSEESQEWLRASAAWLFEKGRWVADISTQSWAYVDEKAHTLCRCNLVELRSAWEKIEQQTDLTLADLSIIDWGQVAITAVEGIATLVLLIAGVFVTVVLAQALVPALAALIGIATTADGQILISALELRA